MAILNIDPLEVLTDIQVSQRTGKSVESIRKDRKTGKGIPFLRWGRSVRYRAVDVALWLEAQTVDPTAGTAKGKPAPSVLQNTGRQVPPHLRGMRGFN